MYGSVSQHQGNPLLELRDNTENLISDAVYEIGANNEGARDAILSQFDFTDPDAEELAKEQHPRTEEAAISNVMVEEYRKSLDEKDRKILRMTMDGYTQDEIARAVGFANNSAISKRIAKLRNDFVRKTGVKIE